MNVILILSKRFVAVGALVSTVIGCIIIMVGKKSSEYEAKSSSWWEKLTYHIKLKII